MADFDSKALFDAINAQLDTMLSDWRLETITACPAEHCTGTDLVEFVAAHVHSSRRVRTVVAQSYFMVGSTWLPRDTALADQAAVVAKRLCDEVARTWPSKPSKILADERVQCGCGRHRIDPKGDVYAQHREWSGDDIEAKEATRTGMYAARGIGISAPEPDPLVVQDPTGDDVAPDAFTTTGGKTLDDIIDEVRAVGHNGPKGTFVRGDGAAFSVPPACSSPADAHRDTLIWGDEEETLRDMMVGHIIMRGKR